MDTYHIHIGGLVQGVGFRPFVCRLAEQMQINGWVSNGNNGVHIEFNAEKRKAESFYRAIISRPPPMQLLVHTIYLHLQQKNITALGLIPATTR